MGIQKLNLDWGKPFLDSVVEWFISSTEIKDHLDLSKYMLLCPVARVSRRLIEKLVFSCEEKQIGLSAPFLISLSNIYGQLLPNQKIVSSAESRLIFLSILERRQNLSLFSSIVAETTELQLLDRAQFLTDTYLELTKNAQTAESSIAKLLASGLLADEQRWLDLSEVFKEYKSVLKQRSLLDTVDALELIKSSEIKLEQPLVLIGSFDLPKVIAETIEAGFQNVISLIFADSQNAEIGFDHLGALNTDFWLKQELEIADDKFKIFANPSAEIENLFSEIKNLPSGTNASQISVGSCSNSVDKFFAFKAKEYNLPVHLVSGTSLRNSGPAQALIAALNYLHSNSFADLSYLLSIPVFSAALRQQTEARSIIDNYRIKHLQPKLQSKLPSFTEKESNLTDEVKKLLTCLNLTSVSASSWLSGCKTFLNSLKADAQEVSAVNKALEQLLEIIEQINISEKTFINLITESLSQISRIQNSEQDEIDVIGWLELTLDDAPYCFVLGMNEKNLPAPPAPNALLPEKVRQFLALDSYQGRLARDKYILQSLLKSKKYLGLSCSKTSLEGDGLVLSRLFLEGSQNNKLFNLKKFFKNKSSTASYRGGTVDSAFKSELKQNLMPSKLDWRPDSLSVSGLNLYYQCPYLFYLQSVVGLKIEDPNLRELSGSQLGDLIHKILADFGQSEIKDSLKKAEIEEYLLAKLSFYFHKDFSETSFAEVRVQYFQIIERLQRFASWQADWRAKGWQIHKVELGFEKPGYSLLTDKASINLLGRIDRLDFNSELNEYALFDYKTSDSLNLQVYNSKHGWQDLQLAVYWLYCKEQLGIEVSHLALLPIAASDLDLNPVFIEVSVDELLQSKELLNSLISDLKNQIFWPPKINARHAFAFKTIYQLLED